MDSVCSSNRLALSLQHLHHDLLLLDQESPHDLFPHSFVGEAATVGAIHLLVTQTHARFFLVSSRLDTLELETSHGTFGHSWAFLEILEHQLSSGSPHGLPSVGLGVVGETATVSDALHHAAARLLILKRGNG